MVHDQFSGRSGWPGEDTWAIHDGKATGAFFLMVEVVYLLLHGPKHLGFGRMVPVPRTDTEIIELLMPTVGEADILHMPPGSGSLILAKPAQRRTLPMPDVR